MAVLIEKTEFEVFFEMLSPEQHEALDKCRARVRAAQSATENPSSPDTNKEPGLYSFAGLAKSKAKKQGVQCPHCRSYEIVRFGKRRSIQWYKCNGCGKTFSGVTGTIWDNTKKDFDTWKDFIQCMIDGFSLRKTAKRCEISLRTAFVWRHKILDALGQYLGTQRFTGIVEADDTYFPLSFKGSKPIGRKARKRGTPAKKRGVSREQVCVSCAVGREGKHPVYSKVSTLGRPSIRALRNAFDRVIIRKGAKTKWVTDGDKAYAAFAEENRFDHIRVQSGLARHGEYHVQNINGYHSRLKRFLKMFNGVSTKHLNNYLVWHNVINEKNKRMVSLLKLCIKPTNVKRKRWLDMSNRPSKPRVLR